MALYLACFGKKKKNAAVFDVNNFYMIFLVCNRLYFSYLKDLIKCNIYDPTVLN